MVACQQISCCWPWLAHIRRLHRGWPPQLYCIVPQCYERYQLISLTCSLSLLHLHFHIHLPLFLTSYSFRSTKHDHVKANFHVKLRRIRTFGNMKCLSSRTLSPLWTTRYARRPRRRALHGTNSQWTSSSIRVKYVEINANLAESLFKGFDKTWGARNVHCGHYNLRITWNLKHQCM